MAGQPGLLQVLYKHFAESGYYPECARCGKAAEQFGIQRDNITGSIRVIIKCHGDTEYISIPAEEIDYTCGTTIDLIRDAGPFFKPPAVFDIKLNPIPGSDYDQIGFESKKSATPSYFGRSPLENLVGKVGFGGPLASNFSPFFPGSLGVETGLGPAGSVPPRSEAKAPESQQPEPEPLPKLRRIFSNSGIPLDEFSYW